MPMLWSKRPNTKIAPQNYDAVRLGGVSRPVPRPAHADKRDKARHCPVCPVCPVPLIG